MDNMDNQNSNALVDVRALKRLGDTRGWFLKVLQRQHLGCKPFGEVYLAVGSPGEIRGSHYHKRTTEWFCPIQGHGMLYVASVDGSQRQVVQLDSEEPVSVRVPAGVAHALVADQGVEFMVLAVADVEYDPDDTDTFAMDLSRIRGDAS